MKHNNQKNHLHWMTKGFLGLIYLFPSFSPKLWGWLYNKVASLDSSGCFLFMNYGYSDAQANLAIKLETEDEPFRYAIQLYHHVIHDLSLNNKDVMEVGCGRGGGGAFIMRYKKPRSFIGVDLSEKAIAWCQRRHLYENMRWLQGRADSLPASDQSMDIIINVESSHCYPSMDKFLQETKRVLRPKGYLALCDLRPIGNIRDLHQAILKSGFTVISRQDITPQVVEALEGISNLRKTQIESVFPSIFHKTIDDFAAIKHTQVYDKFIQRELVYLSYLLQKKE